MAEYKSKITGRIEEWWKQAVLGLPRSITRNFFGEIVEESINVKEIEALPLTQPRVIHCKDCKHYRTTGAFGAPLHKEEYYCDADNYPKNDPGEEQRELPEWWFCAGAERKQK